MACSASSSGASHPPIRWANLPPANIAWYQERSTHKACSKVCVALAAIACTVAISSRRYLANHASELFKARAVFGCLTLAFGITALALRNLKMHPLDSEYRTNMRAYIRWTIADQRDQKIPFTPSKLKEYQEKNFITEEEFHALMAQDISAQTYPDFIKRHDPQVYDHLDATNKALLADKLIEFLLSPEKEGTQMRYWGAKTIMETVPVGGQLGLTYDKLVPLVLADFDKVDPASKKVCSYHELEQRHGQDGILAAIARHPARLREFQARFLDEVFIPLDIPVIMEEGERRDEVKKALQITPDIERACFEEKWDALNFQQVLKNKKTFDFIFDLERLFKPDEWIKWRKKIVNDIANLSMKDLLAQVHGEMFRLKLLTADTVLAGGKKLQDRLAEELKKLTRFEELVHYPAFLDDDFTGTSLINHFSLCSQKNEILRPLAKDFALRHVHHLLKRPVETMPADEKKGNHDLINRFIYRINSDNLLTPAESDLKGKAINHLHALECANSKKEAKAKAEIDELRIQLRVIDLQIKDLEEQLKMIEGKCAKAKATHTAQNTDATRGILHAYTDTVERCKTELEQPRQRQREAADNLAQAELKLKAQNEAHAQSIHASIEQFRTEFAALPETA